MSDVTKLLMIEGVDLDMLERQRIALARTLVIVGSSINKQDVELLDGLLNMLDSWSDERLAAATNSTEERNDT